MPPQLGPPVEVDVGAVDSRGLRRLLDIAGFQGVHRYHGDVFVTADVQRDGLSRQRIQTARFSVDTGNLAAALYEGDMHVRAAPGHTLRLLRVQAYVLDSATVANRWRTPETLDDARLELCQDVPADDVAVVGSANGVEAVGPSPAFAGSSGEVDELVRVTASAVRLTFDFGAGVFMRSHLGAPAITMPAFLSFRWDRTAALNDNDTAIIILHYIGAPDGVYAPR